MDAVQSQDVAGPVLGVLAAAEAFSARAAPASFACTLEVGKGVVMRPHEPARFSLALSFCLLDVVDASPDLADGLTCETSPRASCSALLRVDLLCGFSLCHMGDAWVRQLLTVV